MSKLLIVGGVVVSLLGLVLIPLPGPGYPVLVVGVLLLNVGLVVLVVSNRSGRLTP